MKSRFFLIFSLFLVLRPGAATADFYDGNRLYEECKGQSALSCLGYIVGVADTARLFPKPICVPEGVTAGQLRAVVLKYMEEHPEDRHYSGTSVVGSALLGAFPNRECYR